MSAGSTLASCSAAFAESTAALTALRKTSWPRMIMPCAVIHVEEVDEGAVHAGIPPEERAGTAHRFEDQRPRAVRKEKGVRAVLPVEGPGHRFGPDEEHLAGTGRQHAGGGDQDRR